MKKNGYPVRPDIRFIHSSLLVLMAKVQLSTFILQEKIQLVNLPSSAHACIMVLILGANSEHVAHVSKKKVFPEKKIDS